MSSPHRTRRTTLWMGAALFMPLIIVGSLLGLTASADTALERIPVALVNNDELVTTVDDDGEEEIILASRPLITELVTGDDTGVDWVITDTETANTLLASGDVYAIFEIPAEFSESVLTLDSPNPTQATFTIRTDPTRSYLAGILGDQLGDSIGKALSVEFTEQTTEGLFTVIVELGEAFGEAADAAVEISEGTTELAEGVSELAKSMPELKESASDLASGYAEFDDGIREYTSGVTELSNGLDTLGAGTSGLSDLSAGITNYTTGVTGFLQAISGIDLGNATLNGTRDALIPGGAPLAEGARTALSGLTDGIRAIDKGADALDTAGQELADGSGDIREGIGEFADGVSELADGVIELNDGVAELADGVQEFATGLSDGADEIADSNVSVPSDEALTVLASPVAFSAQDRADAVGAQATLASVILPLGLWLVMLVTLLITPRLSSFALGGTATPTRLVGKTLRPLLVVAAGQALLALTLLHTLGGAAWSTLGGSAAVVFAGVFSYLGLHYLVWVWRSSWLPALSVGFAAVQIASIGTLVPNEIFPAPYRVLEDLTPLSWFTDGLLAAVAGGDPSRVVVAVVALVAVGGLALVLAIPGMKRRQLDELRTRLGVTQALESVGAGGNA